MSIEAVKKHLQAWGKDAAVMEFDLSCATVELAAQAVGVSPARIAKTLSFKSKDTDPARGRLDCILIVAAGDARIDGKKFKDRFGIKSKMLSAEEVPVLTGHAVGGVCPFAVHNPAASIYLDLSLKRFSSVFPACGSSNSMMELSCEEFFEISGAKDWVDVCKDWQENDEQQ